jgi:hypothetical protein
LEALHVFGGIILGLVNASKLHRFEFDCLAMAFICRPGDDRQLLGF